MKQKNSKKGFSLIELIVVIAVIAAIAAVIVPQFTNFSDAARNSADQRNVQLWNQTYFNAIAAGSSSDTVGGTYPTSSLMTANSGAAAIGVTFNMSGQNISFNAPSFSKKGGRSLSWVNGLNLN